MSTTTVGCLVTVFWGLLTGAWIGFLIWAIYRLVVHFT